MAAPGTPLSLIHIFYKTAYNNVATPKLGLDAIFPNSQVNGGIIIAVVLAVLVYILMTKTTLGLSLIHIYFHVP